MEWNALVANLPGAHLLQSWEWAQAKSAFGWQPMPFVWRTLAGRETGTTAGGGGEGRAVAAAAMVLKRPVLRRVFGRRLCILYVPKGPVLDPTHTELRDTVLRDLTKLARDQGAVLVKIDPDVELGRGYDGSEFSSQDGTGLEWNDALRAAGWLFSDAQVQFRNSIWIDLSGSSDELLERMKQKSRYNIRLAERKGVRVRVGTADDIPLLFRMYAETADRDGFVIRGEDYYRTVWSAFMQAPRAEAQPAAEALIAELAGEPIAALLVFFFAGRAYYLYGMSRAAHRDKMPNHLLQWAAMRRAQERGCRVYDLWGAPDTFDASDPMWGVFRFKEGLGGDVIRTIGAWDYPSGGAWYPLYTKIAPRVLDLMRWRGRRRTHDALGGA